MKRLMSGITAVITLSLAMSIPINMQKVMHSFIFMSGNKLF